MKYTRVDHSWFEGAAMLNASDADVATWLRLTVHASKQECGGVFDGAANWTQRSWGRLGTSRRRVDSAVAAGLAEWHGTALRLCGYNEESEEKYKARRENGRKNSRKNGPHPNDYGHLPDANGYANGQANGQANPVRQSRAEKSGDLYRGATSMVPARAQCVGDDWDGCDTLEPVDDTDMGGPYPS